MATVEVDFSGLHIILAYAKEGIDYWIHTEEDPYATISNQEQINLSASLNNHEVCATTNLKSLQKVGHVGVLL